MTNIKLISFLLIGLLALVVGTQEYRIQSLKAINASLSNEKDALEQKYQLELNLAKEAINTQNKAIESYQADLDKIRTSIASKMTGISEHTDKLAQDIQCKLNKDSSIDSQFGIIEELLNDFCSVQSN